MPSIFEIIGNNWFNWDKVNSLFLETLNNRKQLLTSSKWIEVEITFFDIVANVLKGDESAIISFNHYNTIFSTLAKRATNKEKKLLTKIIYSMFINRDIKHRNFFSEIAFVNYIISDGLYHLIEIEHKLPNGKHIDFVFQKEDEETKVYIELMNIHISKQLDSNPENYHNFLDIKFKQKNISKGYNPPLIDFLLVPVILTSFENLKILKEFSRTNISTQNLFPLFCPFSFTNEIDNQLLHYFGPIGQMFKEIKINCA